MKKLVKILSIALALCMALGLAACAKKPVPDAQ